jgi:hypothetical protein
VLYASQLGFPYTTRREAILLPSRLKRPLLRWGVQEQPKSPPGLRYSSPVFTTLFSVLVSSHPKGAERTRQWMHVSHKSSLETSLFKVKPRLASPCEGSPYRSRSTQQEDRCRILILSNLEITRLTRSRETDTQRLNFEHILEQFNQLHKKVIVVCQDLIDKAQRFQMPCSPFSWRQIVIRDPAKGTSGGSATKRKAESDNAIPSKKAKPNAPSVGGRSCAEDEDEDEDNADGDG